MEEIKAYKTTDGKIFEHEEEAEATQAEIDFIVWYEDNKFRWYGDNSDAEEMLAWIRRNKEMVLKVVNGDINKQNFID